MGAEKQGEEKHLSGAEYPSAPLTDEIREVPGRDKPHSTSHSSYRRAWVRIQNSLLLVQSILQDHPLLPVTRGQGRPGRAAEGGRWWGRWPLPQIEAEQTQQPRPGGRGRGGGQSEGRGEGRGQPSGAGQGTRPAAKARAQARLPWGGGCPRCGRCWRCCCCCGGRFPGRTARSPAAARPTAPCAAPARGPASPDCEYAAPRPGTLARSGPPRLPTLWPSLPGSWEKKASSYQIPPFKVVRRQSLGTVFANQCHALGGSPITAHPAASGGPRPAISRFTRLGLRQGAWNCPEATEGEGQLPAAAGRGSVVMLLNSSCLCL